MNARIEAILKGAFGDGKYWERRRALEALKNVAYGDEFAMIDRALLELEGLTRWRMMYIDLSRR